MSLLDRGLRPGDVAPMTSCNVLYESDQGNQIRLGYKAGQKSRMVFMFLGEEKRDGSAPLDVIERLYALGWSHPEFQPGDLPREEV